MPLCVASQKHLCYESEVFRKLQLQAAKFSTVVFSFFMCHRHEWARLIAVVSFSKKTVPPDSGAQQYLERHRSIRVIRVIRGAVVVR